MELEYELDEATFVKPKFYAGQFSEEYVFDDKFEFTKIKGVRKATIHIFRGFMAGEPHHFIKRATFRESVRRGLSFNQDLPSVKRLSLEDEKRVWEGLFDPSIGQDSTPIIISRKNINNS